jgi:hypothetical protein
MTRGKWKRVKASSLMFDVHCHVLLRQVRAKGEGERETTMVKGEGDGIVVVIIIHHHIFPR